jgi:transposase InsO family protein
MRDHGRRRSTGECPYRRLLLVPQGFGRGIAPVVAGRRTDRLGLADLELATAEWVDWFNARRLHSAIGHVPPDEHESMYYAQHQPRDVVGVNC